VLAAFPAHGLNIEIKQGGTDVVDAVMEVLRRTASLQRVLLAAEHDEIMRAIRRAAGERAATSMSVGEVVDFIGRTQRDDWSGYTAPAQALQIPPAHGGIDLVTPASIGAAHQHGMEMHVWTINDTPEIERLLDLDVDGVMSDLPGLVASAVRRRGIC
jgi:glycerophosphoryl diester phosphodiesterase